MNHLNIFKSLLIFSVILLFAACKNKNTTESRDIQLLTDSSAYMNNLNSDTAAISKQETPASNNSVNHSSSQNNGSASTSTTTNTPSTSTGNQNKGMSKAAKGAVIGGAAGAVGGAVISKKAGGAAVGAAVGAASGYIIGRDQDKQDGRVKKKKKKQ